MLRHILFSLLFIFPIFSFAGDPQIQNAVDLLPKVEPDEDVFTYYDLRDRKTYIQLTNEGGDSNPQCIHVQIFQQDEGCSEIDFDDQLTINDTVIYDLDNLVRNNGTEVPINLDDDSYGFVAISSFNCADRSDDNNLSPLIGNVRIIDDSGYEYRMNLLTSRSEINFIPGVDVPNPPLEPTGNIIINYNTIEGAKYADIVGFLIDNDRFLNGQDSSDIDGSIFYNEEVGITFSVFQIDENENRLSCDQKTIGCGPNIDMNYGINEDYPNSKGGPLLCEGAGLTEGQTGGYILLEPIPFLSPTVTVDGFFQFGCLVGLNNGNGTGSMDSCSVVCVDDDFIPNDCRINQ